MSQSKFFRDRKTIGDEGEARLDAFFAPKYVIEPASEAEQRQEIDRWFTNRATGHRFSVEYKTDERAGKTGNAFVETHSSVERDIAGWAYTSAAMYLIYLIPEPETIYIIHFEDFRFHLPHWVKKYPSVDVANPNYTTRGVLVDLDEFERCADFVI